MLYSKYLTKLYVIFFLLSLILPATAMAQAPEPKSSFLLDNWKFEAKGGIGILLSEVPDKYLDRINNVNIPLKVPGPTGVFSVRKGFSGHLEMGYQFDYMSIHGDVTQENRTYNVKTKAMGHSFVILYNLKNTNTNSSRFNYYGYYRVGALSLKNDPTEKVSNGGQMPTAPVAGNEFIKNVAVITGIGLGLNYQLTGNLSLIGSAELNRSSDAGSDVYKIYKIFYRSENTVNNFASLTVGLSYNLNLSGTKKSRSKLRSGGSGKTGSSKTSKKNGKVSGSNYTIWFNPKAGK